MAKRDYSYDFEPFDAVYEVDTGIVPSRSPFRQLSRKEQQVAEQVQLEATMMEGMRIKARIGQAILEDLHDYTNARVLSTTERIVAREQSITNDEVRRRMERFDDEQFKRMNNHFMHVNDAAAYHIGKTVHASLQPVDEPPPPPPRRGLLDKFFG